MARAHIVRRDAELTEIHVPNGRIAILPTLLVAAGGCYVAAPLMPTPELLLIGFPFLLVLLGVMWFQHKTVLAIPHGIEVTYGPLPWPGTAITARQILAIEVDDNPQRYTEDRYDRAMIRIGPKDGELTGIRPSVDAYLHGNVEITLIAAGNVADKAHALQLRDALRDGMNSTGEIAFE